MSFISIPTYNSKQDKWTYTDFETRGEFKDFVWSKFLPPGKIKLKNTNLWNSQANKYRQNSYYCDAPYRSKDFINYWDNEKEKCRKGVIIDDYFISRYYYFWLNFLPINNKETKMYDFPSIYDSQYYFFIYIQLCELEYKYSVVVKKRQWGGSFQHLAILLNDIWFESSYINKLGASDEKYILSDWQMLQEYRNFLNEHTAWYRPFNPGKIMDWEQKVEVTNAGRKFYKGNRSMLKGLNFKTNPTKGVGGRCDKFCYEEAGITNTMKTTFQYMDPALKMGAITTGMFMALGSVGELDECEDLKEMAREPTAFNILPIDNDFEDNPDIPKICFFVPEFWSMAPYIDKEGNSIIDTPTEEERAYLKSIGREEWECEIGAKEWCIQERAKNQKLYSPEAYRMYVSQKPMNMSEAFAWRKESIFPQALLMKQQEKIISENKNPSVYLLEYSGAKVSASLCESCKPITKFPLGEKDAKEGAIQVWEPPKEGSPFLTYFAGVDPVATDKTTTSKSLFSIYIFKNIVEERYTEGKQDKIRLDGYKVVASYTGRYDDLKRTNEIAEKLIVWYNALTAVENNVNSFINHMQAKSLQRYLATKDQLSFISDLNTNKGSHTPYGFRMNETIKTYFIDTITDYLTEELDVIKKPDGTVVQIVRGVSRIRDIALLEELKLYHDKLNVDRFVAFGAGLCLMKSFRKFGLGISKLDNRDKDKKGQIIEKVQMPERSLFKHIDNVIYTKTGDNKYQSIKKSFFKHN